MTNDQKNDNKNKNTTKVYGCKEWFGENIDLTCVTLVLSIEQINEMIDFLEYAKARHVQQHETYGSQTDHSHFQDYRREHERDLPETDIIIVTDFGKKTN